MGEKDNSNKQWAGDKKPSMKRRLEEHNYTERGLYMVTLVIEGRRPLLGTLAGNPAVSVGDEAPHVVLSPLGERVRACWLAIQQYYPQIETMKLCIMPDHIHGILFVHERIERHLGHVINGFKAGTRKAAKELGIIVEAMPQPTRHAPQSTSSPVPYAEALPQPNPRTGPQPSPQPGSHYSPHPGSQPNPQPGSRPNPQPNPQPNPHPGPQPNRAKHAQNGTLWEPGYNDRVLLKKGQLHHWLAYLDDNPRRLLLKRRHPEFFSPLGRFLIAGTAVRAMGNIALLSCPTLQYLQCSRHLYPKEIDQLQGDFLARGRAGACVVSACISPGEQQIATACIEAGIPCIILLVHGFPPYYKPQPLYLKACAEGRLLLLSPFEWQNEKLTDMRQRCLYLNGLAACICEQANRGALCVTGLP